MRRLPWLLFGLFAALAGAGVALLAQVPSAALERAGDSFTLSVTFVAVMVVFGVVGAVVASRLPSNPIGWLFLVLALLEGAYELAYGYSHYALHAGHDATWAAWVSSWTSPLSPPFLVAALLLFPDGRPPSPRWRWVLWLTAPLMALILAQYAFAPGPIDEFPEVTNPLGVEGLGGVQPEPFIFALLLAAATGLVVRYRRSRGIERQQVKWFAYAAAIVAAFLVLSSIATQLIGGDSGESIVAGFAFAACISTLPVAAGVAILRHRLYDVDVVIRRTLVYGALTATLAGAYLALVLLVQLVIGAESDLAIAGSTLAVAALFRPARGRIQAVVDRRFYRRRYDATRTLEAFGARLRDQLDLEALGADLSGVVRDTMQPVHVSLWLKRGAG